MPNNQTPNERLMENRKRAKKGGGQDRIARQHEKGKMTARERISELLDPFSFQEINSFIEQRKDLPGTDASRILGDGVITGYGKIDGRTVYLFAQDFTVMGGSLGEGHSKKICRVMDLAAQNGSPIIGLIDSGGARIQEGVRSLEGYSEIFRRNALYSGVIPQISLIMGPSAGGAAYSPALTDFIFMVEKSAYMFITGPEVIKAVTGEEIDFEGLGGAAVHAAASGVASLTAPDEHACLAMCRKLISYLPLNNMENPPSGEAQDELARMDKSLDEIIPQDTTHIYSMHDVILRIVDTGSFMEIHPAFAPNAITGFAHMNGSVIGLVAQEPSQLAGVLDIDASDKICRFVRFCDAFNIPLVTFVDSPGFLPGIKQEHGGIIRHGAKVIFAYAEASVPKISVVTRKAFGGAYIVMSSKYLGTDVTFAWPTAEIAVMGADGAAKILYRRTISQADDPEAERARVIKEYTENYLTPYPAAKSGLIDEIILPSETRVRIIYALSATKNKQVHNPARKHGNPPV